MRINKKQHKTVTRFEAFVERLAKMLPTKTQPFFLSLLLGTLLAIARRRTVRNGSKPRKSATTSDGYFITSLTSDARGPKFLTNNSN